MNLAAELTALLGSERVLDHPLRRHVYGKDGGASRGEVEIVCLPDSTSEVVEVVRIARRHGLPVIPRGAGTGLAGGAVPVGPAVMVVLTRMDRIEHVDVNARTAWVGPGVINIELSEHTARHGLHYAPDPSSQASCTIGGNVATNAGGLHCLAEGTTVAHVLAVEMVTATGDVVRLGSGAPDPIGLDLRAVVVGSEGTLGIVTRILVKLTENAVASQTLLLSFADVEDAAATVTGIIADGIIPGALEMMDQVTVAAVENFVHAGFPTSAAAVLLAEVVGTRAGVAAETDVIAAMARRNRAIDVEIATTPAQAALWWKGRKSAFGAVAQAAPDYYLHDTVVPRTKLVHVLRQVYEIGRKYDILMMNVFHAGDGNLHPLMAYDSAEAGVLDRVHAAAEEIVRVSIEAGGALSGEHGIGMEKRDLMGLSFGPVDLDAQARLRDAFDPDHVLNPGKVLPAGSRCFDFGRPAAADAS